MQPADIIPLLNLDEHGNINLKRADILLGLSNRSALTVHHKTMRKRRKAIMKVKTGIKAGGFLNETADQAKQAVLTTTGYVKDLRQGVLDAAQSGLEKARQTWNAVVTL
jgi:hypothetical protein